MINRNGQEDKVSDIDDFNVHETMKARKKIQDKDRKLSHERKPSYSSSEKSLAVNGKSKVQQNASINPVKLRESSSLRRQRRTGLVSKDEPHSSSGNWSASSESGRTSIGSEITSTTTTHPKSSASSTSLNQHTHPSSSGPPSSIISRRRFLNTSASSSITSEGTATPEMQNYEDEMETSSVYSCDTEGYYTSFHVDSGLKTLKEEEPITPIHSSLALSSTTSFESSGNQTVISPENEYELFGRGSTSTTTSSAGTVCTAVLSQENERYSSSGSGPMVPERKSSLTKLNRSNSSASSGTLERSYSSSTMGSTLEKSGTIKRNGVLLQKEVAALVHQHQKEDVRMESPDSGNNTSSSPVESNANSSPTQGVRTYSEFEFSESSDLECVDRIERIRVKTTINTSRIPSMCVITPTPSDDESTTKNIVTETSEANLENIRIKENRLSLNKDTGYAILLSPQAPAVTPVSPVSPTTPEVKNEMKLSHFRKATLLPLNNMLGKLKSWHPLKKSPNKETAPEPVYDSAGDYVTIADVKNNNKASNGVYYSNDVVKRNLATVLSGNLNVETEYVSLNELPCNIRCESHLSSAKNLSHLTEADSKKKIDLSTAENSSNVTGNSSSCTEEGKNRGARVTLDAQGKVVYSSDSLKRRKGAYTTFSPGPCVRETATITITTTTIYTSPSYTISENNNPLLSGGASNRKIGVRPVVQQQQIEPVNCAKTVTTQSKTDPNSRMAPITTSQVGQGNSPAPNYQMQQQGVLKGAYVHIQDAAPLRNGPPIYSAVGYSDETGKDTHSPKIISFSPKIFHNSAAKNLKSFSPLPAPSPQSINENVDPNSRGNLKRSNSYRQAAIYAEPQFYCEEIPVSRQNEYDQLFSGFDDSYDAAQKAHYNVNSSAPQSASTRKINNRNTRGKKVVKVVVEGETSPSFLLNKKFMKSSKIETGRKYSKLSQENLVALKRHSSGSKEFNFDENSKYSNVSKNVTSSFENLMNEFTISSNSIISTDISLNESLNTSPPTKSKSFDDLLNGDDSYGLKKDLDGSTDDLDLESDTEFYCKPSRNSAPMYLPSPSKITIPADGVEHRAKALNNSTDIW